MMTPGEDLLSCLRMKGFEKLYVDFVLCESQIKQYKQRFPHTDKDASFGLFHIKLEILNPIQPEFMSFDDICKKFGDGLAFRSMIGVHQLLPYRTAKEDCDQTLNNLSKYGLFFALWQLN